VLAEHTCGWPAVELHCTEMHSPKNAALAAAAAVVILMYRLQASVPLAWASINWLQMHLDNNPELNVRTQLQAKVLPTLAAALSPSLF
jgi:hypothetical protein